LGQSEEAEQYCRKAIGQQKDLLTQSPKDAGRRHHLAASYHYLGNLQRDTGAAGTLAESSYREALAHQEPLTGLYPRNADYQLESARVQNDYGNWLVSAGRVSEAQEAFHKAGQGFQQALQLRPQRHDLLYFLARFLASCPDIQFRNAARATDLAQRAVEQAPQSWYCWRALGQARYRTGDWQASVAALQESMKYYAGGNASDWFFLAMAHGQLGDQSEARRWFDQAVQWMDKYQPKNEELGRFRAEAQALTPP
jgi:tetratricopeptide (TPR) repeat protein